MKPKKLLLYLSFQLCMGSVMAQTFNETFDDDPCDECMSFTRTLAGVEFIFQSGGEDAGEIYHTSGYGDNSSPAIFLYSDEFDRNTTETFTIKRSDGNQFIFTSIFINNNGRDVEVIAYLDGDEIEKQEIENDEDETLDFDDILVDEIVISSRDFYYTFIDTFKGEVVNNAEISITDVTIDEANATANFEVTLSESINQEVKVDFATEDGSAKSGSDYTAQSGTVTFNPGQTSQTISVQILEDAAYEQNETFFVNLSNAENATIKDDKGVGTISNDDNRPTVTISTSSATVAENIGNTSLRVQLSAASYQDIEVEFDYSGTATSGDDYNGPGAITIPAGETDVERNISIINDELDETNETITIDIDEVENGDESGTQQVNITINDDDETPVIVDNQVFNVDENSNENTFIGTVEATDGDEGTEFENWEITSNVNPNGNGKDAFKIDDNGRLRVRDKDDLDYESYTSFTIQVRVSDGANVSAPKAVTIRLNNVDDIAPTIVRNAGITLLEGATETIDSNELRANDIDSDNGSLTFRIKNTPDHGQLERRSSSGNSINSFTQNEINNNQIIYRHDGTDTVLDEFDFSVEDPNGNELNGLTFNIVIIPTDNTPPVVGDDSYSTDEEVTLEVPAPGVLSNDNDSESEEITATLESNPSNGSLDFRANGSFTYTPNVDFDGEDTFTYRANDGANSSDLAIVTITVNGINDAPTISSIADVELEKNEASEVITFRIGDIDTETSSLRVTAESNNPKLLPMSGITLAGDGENRSVQLTPVADEIGEAVVTVKVTDGELEASTTFNFYVLGVNTAPTNIFLSSNQFNEDIGLNEFIGAFTTEDVDERDNHTYTLVNGMGDDDNERFYVVDDQLFTNDEYDYEQQATFSIRVSASDGRGGVFEKQFSLSLVPTPDEESDFVIYTGFTPDGDGINDTWEIDNAERYPEMIVRIYNRSGQEMYRSRGYEKPWDGTYNGKALGVDSYYYIIELNEDGVKRTYKGTVMILK
ncbi:T9SS type B sorting domain-containing protein [Fulvivirga sp. RKSG066]|uniref:Calx-beta domain-containing protein n=1 Tax=Fulvivirga aurantia TaxID=2529383 RepID=UPI0012BBA821|nr:cadherin-like domain-containing protein [Fulvivirga aurantia]MTI22326.1 T9SS type B sorting domain-containing protein [Fulvivirga aurantia]